MNTQNETYREIQNTFEGLTITFRHYLQRDVVYIKLDDNFARSNGFHSIAEMRKAAPILCTYEWLDTHLMEEAHDLAFDPKPAN